MQYKLCLRYVYTFYNFGDALTEDVFEEEIHVSENPKRFTLHDQEDGSFILSAINADFIGKYVTVTYPGKDIIIVHENESVELIYDEYYSVMGDDNHNVYVGSLTLVRE